MSARLNISGIVVSSSEIQGGLPIFAGTRVPVKNLFDYLKGGDSLQEFLDDFPTVNHEQAKAVIEAVGALFTNDAANLPFAITS